MYNAKYGANMTINKMSLRLPCPPKLIFQRDHLLLFLDPPWFISSNMPPLALALSITICLTTINNGGGKMTHESLLVEWNNRDEPFLFSFQTVVAWQCIFYHGIVSSDWRLPAKSLMRNLLPGWKRVWVRVFLLLAVLFPPLLNSAKLTDISLS